MSGIPSRRGRIPSRRGRVPVAVALGDDIPVDHDAPIEGIEWVEVVCGHGVADGGDTPRALRPRRIAVFMRLDRIYRWEPFRPSDAARQGPPSGTRPGLWRLACPVCAPGVVHEMAERRLQARLSALFDAGVSLVDLHGLTL